MKSRVLVIVALSVLLSLVLGQVAHAATPIYVRPGGDDTNCDGTADVDYPGGAGPLACAVQTIQKGIDLVDAGGTVYVRTGTYILAAQVNVNKANITLDGDGAGSTIVQVSGTGYGFHITKSGTTLQDLEIQKTDSNAQNLIYIGASSVSVKNNTMWGQYVLGGAETTRAFEVAYGSAGLLIEGNTIHNLRQPGYFNGSLASPTTGDITGNYIYATRGWVMAGANMTYTGNTWGTGANANVYDMVILSGTDASYYPDIVAICSANNEAVIEDQRVSPAVLSVVFVDAATSYTTDVGGRYHPYSSISPAITRVVSGGTVHVAEGTYAGNIIINKSLTLLGDPGDASAGPGANTPVIDGGSTPGSAFFIENGVSNVTIKGFEMRNFTSDDTGIGNGISAWEASTSNITIQDNYFHDLGYNGVLVGNDKGALWGDHSNWLIKGNVVDNVGYIGFELTNTSNSSIEDNVIHLDSPDIGAIFSSARRSETGLTIKNNVIDGTPSAAFPVIYLYAYDLDMPNPNLNGVVIEGNTISTTGTPYQVYVRNIGTGTITGVEVHGNTLSTLKNLTAEMVDAENNYWGTVVFSEIVPKISGSVDWSPWCNSNFTVCTYTWPVHNIAHPADYQTIQAAVDAAIAGDVIHADAGTYAEQVTVNKSLTISGAGAATTFIQAPATMTGDTSGSKNVVTITGSGVSAELTGFTVEGPGSAALNVGIYVRDGATANIHDNVLEDLGTGSNTLGILVGRKAHSTTGTATITANNISGYDKGGIVVDNAGSSATISGNTVTGGGADPVVAQNGIQISRGATATVTGNTVSGHVCTNSGEGCTDDPTTSLTADGASGILLYVSGAGVTVSGNTLTGNQYAIWTVAADDAQIRENTITGASGTGIAIWDSDQWTDDLGFTPVGTLATIANNTLSTHQYGVLVRDYTADSAYPSVTVLENSITGNSVWGAWADVDVNASANWWGSAVPATVKATANNGAHIDYTPWLASGTDMGSPGFQGDFSTLWVDDDSPQTGTTGRIQEGINLVSGSTLYIANGLYKESNLLVDKSMTIEGESRSGVAIAPAAEDANVDNAFGSSAQNGFIIKAHDVTITKLTLDGRGNSDLTPGKNNYRAGIVTADASYPGGGGGAWNNLHVDGVTIKYPYRRGISVFPRTVSGTLIENSRVEHVAYNHGIYVAGQSQVLANEVDDAFQGIVLDLDTTTPAGLCKVNGNTLTDIGNHPGCWGYDSGSGAYAGQPRAIQFNNADSAGRQVEIKDNTISDNGLEEYAGAVGIYTRLANSSSVVEGNKITLSSGVSFADEGIQAVGMLLGWSYDNGFMAKDNEVHSTKYGIGVMIFGNGTSAHPLTLEGNTLNSTASAAKDTGDGTGIYIANQYLFAGDKNPSYVILQNGNSISGYVVGIAVENIPTSTYPLTLIAHNNKIAGNTAYGLNNTTSTIIDAEHNWWGCPCGPGTTGGDSVSANVDYTPWWANEAMTIEGPGPGGVLIIPTGATTPQAQAILDCAPPGSIIRFQSGSYPGGLFVNNPQLTLELNGCSVGHGSPAFTIVGDDEVIQGPGKIDGGGGGGGGIVVNAGADNFILDRVQVTGWANGIELLGDVDGFKLVDNWIHTNTGHGLWIATGVDFASDSVVTIEGNLFKNNTGNGIQHDGNGTLPAEYNSWGDPDGPASGAGGDGIAGNVDADPWTYVESFFDVQPPGLALERHVPENTSFDVALKADAVKLYGLTFKFTYDTARLTLNSTTFASPWAGKCYDLSSPGTVAYACSLLKPEAEWTATAGTVATFNFTANTLPGDSPATTYLDLSPLELDTSAGAIGGQKVFVNNAGFNAPSVPERNIVDTDDGRIIIERLANYKGYVDLQGRANDSGATVEVHTSSAYGSLLLASGTSASSGSYTTGYISPYWLVAGSTYWFQVDRALYLPTTVVFPVPAGSYAHSKALATVPLTTLAKVVLLGGDASNDDKILVTDLTCIGGNYGGSGVVCGATGWTDVNGDGIVNVQDLSLAGGNLYKDSSPWTP